MGALLILEQEIAVGLEQLERGEATTYDDQSLKERLEQIRMEGRKRLFAPLFPHQEQLPQ